MDVSDPRNLDLKLRRYLHVEYPMTTEECTERMKDLEKECGEAIGKAGKAVEARIKVWILGGLFGLLLAFIGTVIYGAVEAGAYQERVDQQTKQLERFEQQTGRDVDRLEQAIGAIRDLLYRKEGRAP